MQKTNLLKLLLLTTAFLPATAFAQDTETVTPAPDAADEEADDGGTDISAPGAGGFGEEIVVQGRFIPNDIRATPQVVSVLNAEEIARSGDGDIAGALTRVTGLSIAGNGFVYVRGLGDRYSLALLNGSPLPSPEPLKRVVPLDLFPSSLLASAVVQKSYSVNYPGEFGGGVINLTTAAIPEENFVKVSVGGSYNSQTTGHLGYTYYGSKGDIIGYDFGARDVPDLLQAAFDSGQTISTNNYSFDELSNFAQVLNNTPTTLLQRNLDMPANFSTSVTAGYNTYLGDGEFGVIATAAYSNEWQVVDSLQQDGLSDLLQATYNAVRTNNNVQVSGLLGVGYKFGDNNAIRLANVYIHDTLKQTRLAAGTDIDDTSIPGDDRATRMEQRTAFYERQLIDIQGVGEFEFGDFSVDVRGGYANSKRDAPYEREIGYALNANTGFYQNNLQGDRQFSNIAFSELDEDVWSFGVDFAYALPTVREIVLSAGYSYTDTQRSATRRSFEYAVRGNFLPDGFEYLRPDLLLSDGVIAASAALNQNIYLTETSTAQGFAKYSADLDVHGAYAKVEIELLDFVSAEAGVRYETADQSVTLLNLDSTPIANQAPGLSNDYWLPAGTITWNFAEDMQLRVAASKTIARPQFRELANQVYLDTDTDRTARGNRFLQDSELFNMEARAEWYFDLDQRVSLAGFYKEIDNPIEVISTINDGSLTNTFANAPKAELYGAEFELVKFFPLYGLGGDFWETRRLVFIGNYTYSKSKIKSGNGTTVLDNGAAGALAVSAANFFRDGSPLTGQSKHLVNVQFGIEDEERLSQYTILLNFASERVTTRGPGTGGFQPDVIEKPGVQLDFVAREALNIAGREFEVEFDVRNILGTRYSEFQRGDIFLTRNAYDLGTSVGLSISTKF